MLRISIHASVKKDLVRSPLGDEMERTSIAICATRSDSAAGVVEPAPAYLTVAKIRQIYDSLTGYRALDSRPSASERGCPAIRV